MIGFSLAFALTQRKPLTIADPPAVPVAPVKTAEGAVIYANALPGAGSGAAAGGGAAGGTRNNSVAPGGGSRVQRASGGGGPTPTGVSSAGK